MNAPHLLQNQLAPQPIPIEEADEVDLLEYWDILVDGRWLIAGITVLTLLAGIAYALIAKPVYEANLLIQVEDSSSSAKSFLGEASSLFDVKTPASAEMEIIRSRMVIGRAVDATLLYIDARPRYLPVVGEWLARSATSLSNPGFLGFGGYVTGAERIAVASMQVPAPLEGRPFRLIAEGGGRFVLTHPALGEALGGTVGVPLVRQTPFGQISLVVSTLNAKPGAEFTVTRNPRLATISSIQNDLRLTEKGRQSGVIDVSMQRGDPVQLTRILNEIGGQYVRQNVERKAAEAQKTLAFLDVQVPQFKRQLDQSEEAYTRYRNQQGSVALEEEAKIILNRVVDLQSKLLEAQQRRRELLSRFTPEHPSVKTLDEQIAAWNAELAKLNAHVRGLPQVQQDALRLERDVKVNNELYGQLRNNALQLQLIREGKIGNVRLIDEAVPPRGPVKPDRSMIVALATLFGLIAGVALTIARSAFFRGVRNPQEVEAQTGLNVYSTIPLSHGQELLAKRVASRQPGLHLLAVHDLHDPAVESLRSLRTALQFAMLDAANNRVLITGATPGVGKSFVSANFAAVVASSGKRVLLVDADLRKGYLNSYFGLARGVGLSNLIAGSTTLEEALHRGVIPNLDLITTGAMPPNPAELMMSATFSNLLERFSASYDLVIIDTPPVLPAADTLGIAAQAGTLLLVARAGKTHIGELHETAKRLANAGKRVSGVLFNALDLSRRHYGSYGYKYGGYKYRQYSYQAQGGTGN